MSARGFTVQHSGPEQDHVAEVPDIVSFQSTSDWTVNVLAESFSMPPASKFGGDGDEKVT
jgi:hypothetical protein